MNKNMDKDINKIKAVINANIVLTDSMIFDGTIIIEGGKITGFGEAKQTTVPVGATVIDANGAYVGPGFVDIHTHSGGTHWFYDNPLKAAEFHLQNGTTSLLPTLYFNLSKQEYLDAIDVIKQVASTKGGQSIKGLYMEGPYLNPAFGADAENNKWKGPINKNDYMPIIERAGSFAKVWCIAPEREGILDFMVDVNASVPGMVFSVAHSEAAPKEIIECMSHGLKLATHHTDATGTREIYPEVKGVCVDETVNYYDEIFAELICDEKGIHVDPLMLRLILKIKGKSRIILVSDACVFDGPVPKNGLYDGVTDLNFDHSGEIAGSKLSLREACRNMMKHTGSSICDVFRFASLNPALLAKLTGVGRIHKGYAADLVFVDHMINIEHVMLGGELVL